MEGQASWVSEAMEGQKARDTRRDTHCKAFTDAVYNGTGEMAQRRDTRRDKTGKALWVRVFRIWSGGARYKIRLIVLDVII